MTVLTRIAAYKRNEIARAKRVHPRKAMASALASAPPTRGFARALSERSARKGLALIAELKKASPSKGLIRADYEPGRLARAYADGGATCLSVLTDAPSFQGDADDLRAARAACDLPILRKDFVLDPYQVDESRLMGADAILLIMALLDDGLAETLAKRARALELDLLIEVHDEEELARAIPLCESLRPNAWIGVNNRDLRTFETSLEVTRRLGALIPERCPFVSESALDGHEDLRSVFVSGARAVLVGEALMRQSNLQRATGHLLGEFAP